MMKLKILQRISQSIFHVYNRKDLTSWDIAPQQHLPIYGVYHIMLDEGWETLAQDQLKSLKESGLLEATTKLFVSCITPNKAMVEKLKQVLNSEKVEIIASSVNPKKYEYLALQYIKELSLREDSLIYYFHSKGISYQSLETHDRLFLSFQRKIEAWRKMLEYFVFHKWKVAVNVLSNGYDTYSCYRWPPQNYTMYSGSFWWATAAHIRRLPDFNSEIISANRFYSEIWLFEEEHQQFSAFDTIADLYFVRIPNSIYMDGVPRLFDKLQFSIVYNLRKIEKHIFHYNYKKVCQQRFQKLKAKI